MPGDAVLQTRTWPTIDELGPLNRAVGNALDEVDRLSDRLGVLLDEAEVVPTFHEAGVIAQAAALLRIDLNAITERVERIEEDAKGAAVSVDG